MGVKTKLVLSVFAVAGLIGSIVYIAPHNNAGTAQSAVGGHDVISENIKIAGLEAHQDTEVVEEVFNPEPVVWTPLESQQEVVHLAVENVVSKHISFEGDEDDSVDEFSSLMEEDISKPQIPEFDEARELVDGPACLKKDATGAYPLAGKIDLNLCSLPPFGRIYVSGGANEIIVRPGVTVFNGLGFDINGAASLTFNGVGTEWTAVLFTSIEGSPDGGGAINNSQGTLIFNTLVYFNTYLANPVTNGGAIHNESKGSITFNKEVMFTPDPAPIRRRMTVLDSDMSKYPQYGGSIYNFSGGIITFNDLATFDNQRGNVGGALYNEMATMVFNKESVFSANMAMVGGAIYNINGGKILFHFKSRVSCNISHMNGGGVFNQNGPNAASISWDQECRFAGNKAETFGGAVYNSGSLTLAKTAKYVFDGNVAPGGGQDIYCVGGQITSTCASYLTCGIRSCYQPGTIVDCEFTNCAVQR